MPNPENQRDLVLEEMGGGIWTRAMLVEKLVTTGKIPQSTLYKRIRKLLSAGILFPLEDASKSFTYLDGRLRQVLDQFDGMFERTAWAWNTEMSTVRETVQRLARPLPEKADLEGSFNRVYDDYFRRLDAKLPAFLESRKPENELAFAKAHLDIVQH